MPVEDGVGYGEQTPLKIQHFARIVGMHTSITKAVLTKHGFRKMYRYIDLTAGKGSTSDGLAGSPLTFLQLAGHKQFGLPVQADFIERNPNSLRTLETSINSSALQLHPSTILNYHLGTYEEIVPELLSPLDNREFGLVFVDPTGTPPDFEVLSQIAQLRPKMEILIYVSTTVIKRVYQYTGKYLSDYMKDMGKKFWLIRKPTRGDSFKWTFLLGSNTGIFTDYKAIDFLRLDSDEAQSFFPSLNLSTKQRRARQQPTLFDVDEF